MMVKSGLDFFTLKFTEPLQRHYVPEWKFWLLVFGRGEMLLTYMIFVYHWTS